MREQIAMPQDDSVGVIGSETTTSTLVVDLVGRSRERSIVGRTVVVAPQDMDGDTEYAIGTITEVTNRNRFHEDPALRGVVAIKGSIGAGLTGRADVKTARVEVQAVFRPSEGRLRPVGSAMTFAPDTGQAVYLASREVIQTLAEQSTKDLFYLGTLYRQRAVPLPMSATDFSGARGGSQAAFFGPSGSGKTYTGTLFVASQMRHLDMGVLIVDPQGQFTTNAKVSRELPLDLRALAEAQGRKVVQLSVARQVRLPQDAAMFADMLAGAKFFRARHLIGAGDRAGKDVRDLVVSWLSLREKWSEEKADDLLNEMVDYLASLARTGAIFASIRQPEMEGDGLPVDDAKPANRFYHNMVSVLDPAAYDTKERDGQARRKALLSVLAPFLNLFSPAGPGGVADRRRIGQIVHTLSDANTGSAGKRSPRPLYVLSLADKIAGEFGEANEVSRALESTEVQGVILRSLFSALEHTARWRYQETDYPANVLVVLDEAARFTSMKNRPSDSRDLAEDLARYFRELRKYAVGFVLLLQEPAALHESIWKQLRNGFRAFAGGLMGSDLDRVREQIGPGGALRLYSQLAQPSADNPVYPFMLCGSVSPLSASANPLFLEVFSGHDGMRRWEAENAAWLPGVYNAEEIWHGHNDDI